MIEPTTDDVAMRPSRGWPRAAGLLGVVFATSVLRPSVLVAVPLLMLLARNGLRSVRVAIAAAVAAVVMTTGARDGVWFAERAWAVLVGGAFVGQASTSVPP